MIWSRAVRGIVLLAIASGFSLVFLAGTAAARRVDAPTIVSLEFDHAFTDQQPAIELANGYGMPTTIFAMSGRLGTPGYMTATQLRALQAQGNEIGGHTINHPDLSQLPGSQQRYEVCQDRAWLEADGLDVTDFAYPYGHFDAATPGIVRSCGYQSARQAGGLAGPEGCSGLCPAAETIPPRSPFETLAADSVLPTTSLSTIEGYVTNAERHTGGWVQVVFHYVCNGCDPYSVSMQTLSAFLAWLAPRSALGTRVETVREVINTTFEPGRVRIRSAGGRGVRLRAALACPSTPVGTRCRRTARGWAPLAAVGGQTVTVLTRSPARSVRLRLGHRSIAGTGAGRRWHLLVPAPGRRSRATLTITYRLGLAEYRLRISRP